MAAGVISVGGKKYAVGLYWQVSDLSNASRAAKLAANQPGSQADFYCVRAGNNQGRIPQFGLGEQQAGHKWNMPTAAASLANRQPGSWSGVFLVPEGVWFVEVRDDLIAPEGDQLFADEAEAMSRLQEASARGGLEKIYAPTTWGIPGAEASSLPSLLSGRADCRLQPVRLPIKYVGMALGGIIGVLFVLWLGFYIKDRIEQSRLEETIAQQQLEEQQRKEAERLAEEERQRKEEEERQRLLAEQAKQMPTYQRVWENLPRPLDWLKACQVAMTKVQIAPLGWNLSAATCAGNQLVVTWSRSSGPAILPPDAQVSADMNTASGVFDLPDLKPRGEEKLWPAKAITAYVLRNEWKAGLTVMGDDEKLVAPNGQPMPPPPWRKRQVQWTVDISPWNLKGPLVDLPGLILQNLVWAPGGTWQMQGTLYEQRN